MAAISTLTDTFSATDTAKWTYFTGASNSNGLLSVTCDTSYPGVESKSSFDLTGSYIYVRVVQAANAGNGTTQTFLSLNNNSTNDAFQIIRSGTDLLTRCRTAGVDNYVGQITYDANVHRYWRIIENAGTVLYQASVDAASWIFVGTTSYTFSITAMTCYLGCGYYGTEPSPGSALYDDLNLPPVRQQPSRTRLVRAACF